MPIAAPDNLMTADSPYLRRDAIARVLGGVLLLNLAVAVAKLLYGYRSGAISITADGVHSLLDGSSNVIGLIGVFAARKPPDSNHPYGHRKYETFAALGVAAMMFFGCMEILATALERWRHPRLVAITGSGFVVLIATIAVNLFVVAIERREGRRLQSELLASDAAHTGSDVLASLLVMVSFAATRFGISWADLAAAVLIVALIVRAGFGILKGTMSTLSDERRIEPKVVEHEALAEPGVLEAHNVRSRGPDDDIHLDLHILVDPGMRIADAHRIGHRVEGRLRERWPGVTDVIVHVEPGLESERGTPGEEGELKAEG